MPRPALLGCLLLVVLGVVCGCGATRGIATAASASSSNAIPWIAVAGTVFIPTPATLACSASDLRVKVWGNGVWHGEVTEDITLVNSAPAACFFPGPPSLRLASPGKSPIPVETGTFATQRIDLKAKQEVEVILECNSEAAKVASTLILSPAGGGSVTVGIKMPADCANLSILAFQQGPDPTTPTGVGALSVQLHMPATVVRGELMSYTVSLHNTDAETVYLSPCPSYSQGMGQPQGATVSVVHNTYLLNCQEALSVPANSSLTFQMVMRIPTNWKVGPAKFLWNLEVEGQPAAGTAVEVT